MTKTIRVTRQGLTQCPQCQQHIKLAGDIEETVCPFCQAELVTGTLEATTSKSSLGKRGLMAGSVLGLSTLMVACAPAVALYGIPADGNQQEATQDAGAQETTVEQVADAGPVPKYGLPPDQ